MRTPASAPRAPCWSPSTSANQVRSLTLRQVAPQRTAPTTQSVWHVPASQTAASFVPAGHVVHDVPQQAGFVSGTHAPASARKTNPLLHCEPHVPPRQVAVAFAPGAGQATQLGPHAAGLVSAMQVAPHAWKPALQVKPHVVPLQVAVPFAGAVQGVQDVPQLATDVFAAQLAPHA